MSANRPNDPPTPSPQTPTGGMSSGAATTGVTGQGRGTQIGGPLNDTERKVAPVGDMSTKQPIPTPTEPLPDPQASRSTLTAFMGTEEDEDVAPDEGFGPKVVVLFDYVRGFARGRVVRVSQLLNLGDEAAFNQNKVAQANARAEMSRLVGLKAVREANSEEAKHTQVTFIEGEQALGSALETAQATILRLQKELEEARQGQGEQPSLGDDAKL